MRPLSAFFLAALALLLARPALGQQPAAYLWGNTVSNTSVGTWGGITSWTNVVTPAGDSYVGYQSSGPFQINGQLYTNTPPDQSQHVVLLHYAADGTPLAPLLRGFGEATLNSVQLDAAGNIYAMGRFTDSVVTATTTLRTIANSPSMFIGKWNAAGTLQWLQHGEFTSVNTGSMSDYMAVDGQGHVVLAGAVSRTLTLGSLTLTGPQWVPTTYCLRLDPAGNPEWGWTARSPSRFLGVYNTSVSVDPTSGTIMLAGYAGRPDSTTSFTWHNATANTARSPFFCLQLDGATGDLKREVVVDMPANYAASQYFMGLQLTVAAAGNDCSYLRFTFAPDTASRTTDTLRLNGAPIALQPSRKGATVFARLNAVCVPQWTRLIRAGEDGAPNFTIQTMIGGPPLLARSAAMADNRLYLSGSYSTVGLTGTAFNLLGQPVPVTTCADGLVAAIEGLTGQAEWVLPVGGVPGAGQYHDKSVIGISVNTGGQLTLSGGTFDEEIRFGSIVLPLPAWAFRVSAFLAKAVPRYNQVQGAVFVDTNADGVLDSNDRPLGGTVVECQPSGTFFTTAPDGSYSAITELGTQTVSLPHPPPYYTLPNPPAPAAFTSYGNVAPGRDFALLPIANQQDLQVFVTPTTRARPGFPLRYRVTYRNIGTTTTSGTVAFTYDSRLTYLGNTGGATASGLTLTAPYAALAPGQSRDFDVQFQIPTLVPGGAVLAASATIEPVATDQTPADNVATDALTVTTSYDPNDIRVNWARLTTTQVAAGEWLEYTIRFENVGTDTAFSILIRDLLPASQLDLGSFDLFAATHGCFARLAANGQLTLRFDNIQLPYRNINALASSGFVCFRLKARTTLVPGDVVPNQAEIHFDYNAPLTTNTALTVVQAPTGLAAEAGAASGLGAWPNPASGTLHAALLEPAAGPVSFTLLDNVGRTVLTHVAPDAHPAALDVRALPAGLYLLRAQTTTGRAFTQRVVVR